MALKPGSVSEDPVMVVQPHVVGIAPTPHGGIFVLDDAGSIFERVKDPNFTGGPQPVGYVWHKVKGPHE
jgi:hypothetical protein